MIFIKRSFFIFLIFQSKIFADPLDYFLAWGEEIKDSNIYINQFVNHRINIILKKHPNKKCEKVVNKIGNDLGRIGKAKKIAYDLIKRDLRIDRFPHPRDPRFTNPSEIYMGITKVSELDPIISINGIRITPDKIGHFFGIGQLYYRYYRKSFDRNYKHYSFQKADKLAFRRAFHKVGIRIEKAGSFSLGDLEANYQGLRFFKSLCRGKDYSLPRLLKKNGEWVLYPKFNMVKFITPNMDESWSGTLPKAKKWKKSRPHYLKFCEKKDSLWVQNLFSYYSRFEESESAKFVNTLINRGKIKDPNKFRLDHLCPNRYSL